MRLNPRSAVPLHAQLQRGLQREIESGALAPGDQLPTVQELARRCRLSTHTVMRAYAELRRAGVVEARRGAGTFVAERRALTTEVLLPEWCHKNRGLLPESYLSQLLEGLSAGFGDAERRFSFAHINGQTPPAREVVDVCAARRADSVIAYGAEWAASGELAAIGESVPTVSLLNRGVAAGVDAVDVDPCPALRTLVNRRLASGRRAFAFIGYTSMLASPWGPSIYQFMLDTFCEMLGAAGITPSVHVPEGRDLADVAEAMRAAAASVPAGATLLAVTPSVARIVDPEHTRFDTIAYTESRDTVQQLENRIAMIYLGIDEAAQEAARMLAVRRQIGPEAPPRKVVLSPRIYDTQGRAEREK